MQPELEEIELMQSRKQKKTAAIKSFRVPERMCFDLLNRAVHSGHSLTGYVRWVLASHLYGVVRAAELGFENPIKNLDEDEDE